MMSFLQKIIVFVVILILSNSCSNIENKRLKEDIDFSKAYMQKFTNGMLLSDVRSILILKKNHIEFYNECTEKFEYPVSNCKKGYNLVTVIKLPSNSDLQIYFTFNSEKILIDKSYEMYLNKR